jgi:hypothetical protein
MKAGDKAVVTTGLHKGLQVVVVGPIGEFWEVEAGGSLLVYFEDELEVGA